MTTIHKGYFFAAAFLISTPVIGQPLLSGKYLVTSHEYCIPTMTVNSGSYSQGGNYVTSVTLGGSNVRNSLYLATFNSAKNTVSISGFDDEGNVMLMQYTGSVTGNSGSPFIESPASGKGKYSNTDTTVTINAQVYNAFYGQIDKNNIAHYVATQAVYAQEDGRSCSEQGVGSRQ